MDWGRDKRALARVAKAQEKYIDALIKAAFALYESDKYSQEANKMLEKVLKMDPKNVSYRIFYGIGEANFGNWQKAIYWFDRALVIDPKNVEALFNKGSVLESWGKHSRAINWYDKVLKIDPKNVDAKNGKKRLKK